MTYLERLREKKTFPYPGGQGIKSIKSPQPPPETEKKLSHSYTSEVSKVSKAPFVPFDTAIRKESQSFFDANSKTKTEASKAPYGYTKVSKAPDAPPFVPFDTAPIGDNQSFFRAPTDPPKLLSSAHEPSLLARRALETLHRLFVQYAENHRLGGIKHGHVRVMVKHWREAIPGDARKAIVELEACGLVRTRDLFVEIVPPEIAEFAEKCAKNNSPNWADFDPPETYAATPEDRP